MKRIKKNGFTLIELLVVIAIVSLLSSIVMASLNSARAKARDAKRMEDLHQIQLALEMYYHDFGKYPEIPDTTAIPKGIVTSYHIDPNDSEYRDYLSWSILGDALINNGYISELPVDPINRDTDKPGESNSSLVYWNTTSYIYMYSNLDDVYGGDSDQTYDLIARLETDHPNRCEEKSWKVHSLNPAGRSIFPNMVWCSGGYTISAKYIYADH